MTKQQHLSRKAAARKAARKAAARKVHAQPTPKKCSTSRSDEFWAKAPKTETSNQRALMLAAIATNVLQEQYQVQEDDTEMAIMFSDNENEIAVFWSGASMDEPQHVLGIGIEGKNFNLGFKQLSTGLFCIVSEVEGSDLAILFNAKRIDLKLDAKDPNLPFFA